MPRATTLSEADPTGYTEPLLISAKEAARLLGVSRNHVYDLLKEGLIESRPIGRRRMVVMSSLREFAETGA